MVWRHQLFRHPHTETLPISAAEPATNILTRRDDYAQRDTDVSEVVALDDVTFTTQVSL